MEEVMSWPPSHPALQRLNLLAHVEQSLAIGLRLDQRETWRGSGECPTS